MGKILKAFFVIVFFSLILCWFLLKLLVKLLLVCLGIYAIGELLD